MTGGSGKGTGKEEALATTVTGLELQLKQECVANRGEVVELVRRVGFVNEAIAEDVPEVAASMKRRQQAQQERGWSHAEDSRQQQYGQLLIDEHLQALEAELWALPQMGQVMRASKL